MGKEGILGEAEYDIRRPMPGITAGASPTPRHGGWWRPMGAASHRPHARSLRPNATKATGPNPVPTLPLWPKAFQTKWTNQLKRAEEKRKQTKALKS